jgi:hypothetical protein
MKKIFFDMDGVLAEYRRDCTEDEMNSRGYFVSLKPEWNMVNALNRLLENGVSVCVLTKVYPSMFKYSVREKQEWRDRFLPLLYDSEFIMVNGEEEEKSEAIRRYFNEQIDGDCILIDDYNPNLAEWTRQGGRAVKYVNGINDKRHSFVGERLSYTMSEDEIFNALYEMVNPTKPVTTAA